MSIPTKSRCLWIVAVLTLASQPAFSSQQDPADRTTETPRFDCGFQSSQDWLRDVRAAVERGEISDPRTRPIPAIPPAAQASVGVGEMPCISPAHIFPYEDSAGLLLTSFSNGELLTLMAISDLNALSVLVPRRMLVTQAALDAMRKRAATSGGGEGQDEGD